MALPTNIDGLDLIKRRVKKRQSTLRYKTNASLEFKYLPPLKSKHLLFIITLDVRERLISSLDLKNHLNACFTLIRRKISPLLIFSCA